MLTYKNMTRRLFQSKNKMGLFLISYSISFCILCVLVFASFIIQEKSLIWTSDGMHQHYPALMYVGRYIREIVRKLFETGHLSFGMWDNTIGFGSDILTTLNYYSIGDPLDVLAGFVPTIHTELVYNLLIILRIYLAGLAFSYYSFYKKNRVFTTYLGTLMYVFSGVVLFSAVRHPFFMNPLIYLPLILVGLERILKGERSLLFPVMICLSLISNFYFFYSICIFMFFYALLRFFELYKENRGKNFLNVFFRTLKSFTIGVLCSMVIFLPVLVSFVNTSRSEGGSKVAGILYNLRYYMNLIGTVFEGKVGDNYTCLGFSVLAMLFFVIFVIKKKKNTFKTLAICSFIMLLFPIFGYIMNGFSYVSNRWTYLLAFVICYIFVSGFDLIWEIRQSELKIVIICAVIYSSMLLVVSIFVNKLYLLGIVGVLLVALMLLCIFISKNMNSTSFSKRKWQVAIVLIFVIDLVTRSYGIYSKYEGNYVSEFVDQGEVFNTVTKNSAEIFNGKYDCENYRVDVLDASIKNYGMVQKLPSIQSYFSITQKNVSEFSKMVGNSEERSSYNINGLDNRTELNALASVKYLFSSNKVNNICYIPYGYKKILSKKGERRGEEYYVYENEYALPIMYGYDSYLPLDEFLSLSFVQREQAMLQGVVLDEDTEHVKCSNLTFSDSKVMDKQQLLNSIITQIQEKNIKSIKVVDDKIYTYKNNVSISIPIKSLPNSESYLELKNVSFESYSRRKMMKKFFGQDFAGSNRIEVKFEEWLNGEGNQSLIQVMCNNKSNNWPILTDKAPTYFGKNNTLLNLGYNKEPIDTITIKFLMRGEYCFEDMSVISKEMSKYSDLIDERRNLEVSNINQSNNEVSANVIAKEDSYLCLSVPYNSGWRAYVDEQKVDIVQANLMYMAIPVTEGEHSIRFSYCTPGLKLGGIITLVGIMLLILDTVYFYLRKRKRIIFPSDGNC